MEWIVMPKIGIKHKIGNMIIGIARIIDGIILFISLGNISSQITLNLQQLRLQHNILLDNKK